MPWAIFNRPSIQLGALKAYVEGSTGCQVTTLHPYLHIASAIGTDSYAAIADNSWAGESLFAALLFAEQKQSARRNFLEGLGAKAQRLPDFDTLLDILESSCAHWLNHVDWSTFRLAGFSLCFNQLLASLYMARLLQEVPGAPPIVFGGSACSGSLGNSLLDHFPQIDYIIDGEGELPLAGLCNYLCNFATAFPKRVLARRDHETTTPAPEIDDLNTLPTPDYAPYFEELKAAFPESPFIPILPVEFSRGCWWNKCTFCNLNVQWCGYRWKKAGKVFKELAKLTARHQCLDYTFTDNALPAREAEAFFASTATGANDFRFFAEIRGITRARSFADYRKGGLDTIQVGIESLSASLLIKMQKGVSVIDNIATMKYAMAADIHLEGNLIVEFPGSTPAEVTETLENLEFVLPYKPLSAATFFLGHGSPIDRDPRAHGITAITQHHKNRRMFPARYRNGLTLLVKEYRGDRQQQRRLWRPVREKMKAWQDFHHGRRSRFSCPLSYRDGGTFILIRQERPLSPTLRHRLQGLSRAIYLFCSEIRTVAEIIAHFTSLKESAILAFIHQLCQKRLMYREHDRILSLAIHQE